jgi:NADH-quinone oxidoreductase subunit N
LTAEIVLVVAAVLIYVGGAFVRAQGVWGPIALGAVVLAAAAMTALPSSGAHSGPLEPDGLASYVRWLALLAGALFVLLAWRPLATPGTSEYLGSLLLAVVGIMLVAAAGDLVLLFVGLELVSIPTYILLYLGRRDAASQEATAKYFFLSILASAMLLYGFSFLYGTAGSTSLREIQVHLAGAAEEGRSVLPTASLALVLIFAGLGFKIAAVPFHFYAPDVYQGTTHTNAGLLSVVPKIAGFIALVRVVAMSMQAVESHPWRIAAALAILTMTFGNVAALWQKNLRRLLAYSSIAHAGYMLIGLSVYLASGPDARWASLEPAGTWDGVAGLLFYLLVYAVATTGAFAALACLGRGEKQINDVDELAGLGWSQGTTQRLLAWTMVIFMFSLAGIPPLAGFWGKLVVFASALGVRGPDAGVSPWFIGLAIIGVLNAAVAAAYYLRIVGVMFFRMPRASPQIKENAGGPRMATLVCAALVLCIGIWCKPWIEFANNASPRAPLRGLQGQVAATLDSQPVHPALKLADR